MFRKVVGQHQLAAVDAEMGVHQPPAVLGRVPLDLLGAERLLVEIDRLGRAAVGDGEIGCDSAHADVSLPSGEHAYFGRSAANGLFAAFASSSLLTPAAASAASASGARGQGSRLSDKIGRAHV